MERHFEKDVNDLKERLLWMGSLAERAVHQSVHAVLESDEQLAKRVLDEEDAINEMQIEIDDRVVQLLALHQLMASTFGLFSPFPASITISNASATRPSTSRSPLYASFAILASSPTSTSRA